GAFEVQTIHALNGYDAGELLQLTASLEQHSSHPIARAILDNVANQPLQEVQHQQEMPGKGLRGEIGSRNVVAGTREWLEEQGVAYHEINLQEPYTFIHVAVDGVHAGTIGIADRIKADSKETIEKLRGQGLDKLTILSGDNQEVVDFVADVLGVDEAF